LTLADKPRAQALQMANVSTSFVPCLVAACDRLATTVKEVLSRKQYGHFIAKVAMNSDPRSEIARADTLIGQFLLLGPADAYR
jgi:hypothetical protein